MTRTVHPTAVEPFGAPLTLRECLVSAPVSGERLINVSACGVCHTDLHAAQGDRPGEPALPFIPGHEAAGHVAGLGPGVSPINARKWTGARAHSLAE